MDKGKIDKVIVARKLLEKYLKHFRHAHQQAYDAVYHNKNSEQNWIRQNWIRVACAEIWNELNFDKEFGAIGDPATQQYFK
ncbi:MAG TPA: hypothetical protein ENH82_19365 [bacterium]|nr:hypothetical protein [bacterium]